MGKTRRTGTDQASVKGRIAMKTAIHSIALIACFASYAAGGGETPVAGMRRAIQTFSAVQGPAPETYAAVMDTLPG